VAAPNSSEAVRRLFLRLLGLVYLAAFLSLAVQVEGLIGSKGILPVAELLDWARARTGPERHFLFPSLFWLNASDAALAAASWGGAILSCLLLAGLAPAPLLFALWALYLSLTSAGQIFLGYQWDALLLETGFLAIFWAPFSLRLRPGPQPPAVLVNWLLRWLLFRLMFSSGVVKLLSGDPTWRDLTALRYHYWTQPLPTWTAWYVDHLPGWFHAGSLVAMLAMELAVPLLIFAPRRLRLVACGALVALQLAIAATGNYAFFNLLTIVLCLVLLDDRSLPEGLRRRLVPAASGEPGRGWPRWVLLPLAALVSLLSAIQMSGTVGLRVPWPAPARAVYRAAAPFQVVNGYGLFAVMTTRRPEILVEGSDDGVAWKAYELRWKPGDVTRAPAFVAPHQPRLDWQMWFAALETCEANPWLLRFLARLLDGSPPVVGLLERNPFPRSPPRLVRAVLYEYRFTDARESGGAWWRREEVGLFCPVLSREEVAATAANGGA
jgi:hypothetical protein